MEINFNGYRENVLTFAYTGTVAAGTRVKMSASGTVAPADANGDFIGVVVSVRGGYAAVQIDGYVECAKDGTVNTGVVKLVNTSTGVKAAESGIDRLVIYTDSNTVGFIL